MSERTNCWGDDVAYDYNEIVSDLNALLRLRATIVGMKRFRSEDELKAIPKLRRPPADEKFATDQIVGQSRWHGTTLGITMDNLIGAQCGAVVGLYPRNDDFLQGKQLAGVWFEAGGDAAAHQQGMSCASYGDYAALAVSPLTSERLGNPDICLIYATPGQMILFINGLQWSGYKKLSFTCVGESSCADSWGNALKTGEPSVSIPCYAERRFGGVQDDEMLMAIPPSYLPKVVAGLKALSRNGLRYPIPNLGLTTSPEVALKKSYG